MEKILNIEELNEAAQDVRRTLDGERERLVNKVEQMDDLLRVVEAMEDVLADNERLKAEAEELRVQLQEEKEARTKVEMQLNEMIKLSASVAGKASQEELLKAIKVFVNKSKRKKLEKRTLIKEMVLELVLANGITLPADLAGTIASLDDEQTEGAPVTTTVNVAAGGINVQQADVVKK